MSCAIESVASRLRRRFRPATLVGLLVIAGVANAAAEPVRQILVLQSFDRGNLSVDRFTGNFRVELDRRGKRPMNVVQIVVGPTGSAGAPEQGVVDYIRATFVDRPKPDLIVTIAGPAAVFARKYRQQLFPDTPTLLAAVDQRYLGDAPLGDNETAVAVDNDFARGIENILQLLPQTRQVFVVVGSGQQSGFWRRQLEDQFTRRFHDRLAFVWLDDLSLPELLRRCASLPENSAIFHVTFGTDASGAAYADDRVVPDLHGAANAPLFAMHSVFLGAGIVGGPLLSIEDLSRDTADVAIRLLNGAAPRSITVAPRAPGSPEFDWRELQRWAIPENRLPPASVVRFRAPGLWEEHRNTVLSAAGVLAVQSLLIVGLLQQRRARRRAEIESRRNLALAADAGRRETMSALTSSISHELGQPLSSIMHNAEALQLMVAANRAPAGTIEEILTDIQTQGLRASQIIDRHRTMLRSHQLEKKPIDLNAVIEESLALVAHDLHAQKVDVIVNLSPLACVIEGDQVLLKQVLVNLLLNAMDAVAGMPPARRRLTVRSDVRAAAVDIVVRDTGTGLSAELGRTLFTPFVTTKSNGLGIGLTIVRTIVDAHDGTIEGHNNLEGGATFTVTLRRSGRALDTTSLAPATGHNVAGGVVTPTLH